MLKDKRNFFPSLFTKRMMCNCFSVINLKRFRTRRSSLFMRVPRNTRENCEDHLRQLSFLGDGRRKLIKTNSVRNEKVIGTAYHSLALFLRPSFRGTQRCKVKRKQVDDGNLTELRDTSVVVVQQKNLMVSLCQRRRFSLRQAVTLQITG